MTGFIKFTKNVSVIGWDDGELFFTHRGSNKDVKAILLYHPELKGKEITEETLLKAGFQKVS